MGHVLPASKLVRIEPKMICKLCTPMSEENGYTDPCMFSATPDGLESLKIHLEAHHDYVINQYEIDCITNS